MFIFLMFVNSVKLDKDTNTNQTTICKLPVTIEDKLKINSWRVWDIWQVANTPVYNYKVYNDSGSLAILNGAESIN